MRADSVGDRFAGDSQRSAAGILVDSDLAEIRRRRLPFQLGQLLFARRADQSWLGPIGPIAAVAVAAVGHDQIQLFRAAQFDVDLDGVARCLFGNRFAGKDRFGGGGFALPVVFTAANASLDFAFPVFAFCLRCPVWVRLGWLPIPLARDSRSSRHHRGPRHARSRRSR